MISILFLAISISFTVSDFILITESKIAPLEKVKEVPFSYFVKIRTDKAIPMELSLISGDRQIFFNKGNTNRKIRLPLFNDLEDGHFKIDNMVIKVWKDDRKYVYKIKVLPRIPADNSFGTEEDRKAAHDYED